MSVSTGLVQCVQIQESLNDNFTSCDPSLIRESLGVIEFLVSNLNTNNTLQKQVSPGNGKKRQVELLYDQRLLESAVGDSTARVCTSANKYGEEFVTYQIDDDGVSIDWQIDTHDLIQHCQDDAMYFAKQLQLKLDVLLRRMDTKAIDYLRSQVGNFAVGETNVVAGPPSVKTVQTKYSDTKINENALVDIQFAAANAGYCGNPVLFGWGELWKYMRKFNAGCCAASGLNFGDIFAQNGAAMVGDYRIETLLGTNNFLSVAPGAAQLLWFNEFAGPTGIRTIDTEQTKQTVITDPATGIPFDFFANFVCGVWHFQLKLAFKVVAMPTDMFKSGDRLFGVNWINQYVITNP